jgi:hypothetical protein
MDEDNQEEGPLKAEALARDKWRGDGGTFLDEKDAPGHTLPESERDRATRGGSGRKGSGAVAGTILPPD